MTAPLTKHPAKFSEPILAQLRRLVDKEQKRLGHPIDLLDPFAGVGRVHLLASPNVATWGLEIEEPWAACHERTIAVDARRWLAEHPYVPFFDGVDLSRWDPPAVNGFHMMVTSVCYGNRLADHHEAKDGSTRRSYRHDLGRMPTEGSAATLHWGRDYQLFHASSYRLMYDAMRPGGLLLLNVKNLVRGQSLLQTTLWHLGAATGAGFEPEPRGVVRVPVKGLRYGANHGHGAEPGEETRDDHEVIYQLRRPIDG